MDQELKQRLIGAAVITALAAIFVPMLFDDPIDESGKSINELKIPELPSKAQDVEIMPLPERVEDVATVPEAEKPPAPKAYEDEGDLDITTHPRALISEDDVARTRPKAKLPEPTPMVAEEDDVPSALSTESTTSAKTPSPHVLSSEAAPKSIKPSASEQNATTRWYLNVGSFSKKSNATAMLESLKKQGFAVSIKEAASDKGAIYRVRVGPMLDRAKAQEMKSKLAKININSFVADD